MAKQTLLELTQGILSLMDGDEVNSISDTIEATQVAEVVRQCYFDLVDELDLPYNGGIVNLTGLGDTDKPTHMLIPESVIQISWIKYDTRIASDDPKRYADIYRMEPKQFIEYVNARNSTDEDNYLVVMENANTPLVIGINSAPRFWTSFDDEYIVFDSYDSSVDTTLQTSKNICHGYIRPEFDLEDDSIPDLPENQFTHLAARAASTAIAHFKQELNQKAEQRERRHRIRTQRSKWRQSKVLHEGPNFGRK